MNPLLVTLVAAGVAVLSLYFLMPGMFLRFGLLLYEKDHDRRREFIAELRPVPYLKRPFWVGGLIVFCSAEELSTRLVIPLRYEAASACCRCCRSTTTG